MNDLISVIIPVFKVENYLRDCVESVIAQTYSNLEIILVDDGSPDSCPIICDEFAKKDSRIKVLHKGNGGLSSARNAGLAICTGDFVEFVDSDDIIDINMIKKLYDALKETNADISCCRYYKSTNIYNNLNTSTDNISVYSNLEILQDLYCNRLQNVICWNKLFKKSLFQQIHFPVGKVCEDIFTTYKVFYEATKITKISYVGYFYRDTQGSITNTFNARRLDSLIAYKECNDFFISHNIENLITINAQCALIAIMRFWYITNDKNVKKSLNEYLNFFYPIANNSKTLTMFKIRCILFKHFRISNSFILFFADFFRNLKYKSNPKIMG